MVDFAFSEPDDEDAHITVTPPVIEIPEHLSNAQRKAVDHMARLQRDTKPSIMTMYWNGRCWQFWEGRPAGIVVG